MNEEITTESQAPPTREAFYRERRDRYAALREQQQRLVDRLAYARLLTFGLVIVFAVIAIWQRELLYGLGAVLSLIGFVISVAWFRRAERLRRRFLELVTLNDESIERIARDWRHLPVRQGATSAPDHPYAVDLDIYGQASLYHLLDPGSTSFGTATLAGWLGEPASLPTIRARQESVAELSPEVDFRDELATSARLILADLPDQQPFLQWASDRPWLTPHRRLLWAARISPILLGASALAHWLGVIAYPLWIAFLIANLAVAMRLGNRVYETIRSLAGSQPAVNHYAQLLRLISGTEFDSARLRQLQASLLTDATPAHQHIGQIDRLLSFVMPRNAVIYFPLQIVTLWDVHLLAALERWQVRSGAHARSWLEALGEVEALSALARLRHDNPQWCFPDLDPESDRFAATNLGHPLLSETIRVGNDVVVGPPGSFLLVTGSNMSGKSTLLRAIGSNVVLAQAGGPVCAGSLRLPPLQLWTAMRVQDSLEQGISYFMAELLRLKRVVDAAHESAAEGRQLCYLLDEILQGTNTAERQVAARRIILTLLAHGAIGVVSTHDLTLAESEELDEPARRVHFRETFSSGPNGPTMSFDHRLRPGLATSRNALRLMEIVGLDGVDPADLTGRSPHQEHATGMVKRSDGAP